MIVISWFGTMVLKFTEIIGYALHKLDSVVFIVFVKTTFDGIAYEFSFFLTFVSVGV